MRDKSAVEKYMVRVDELRGKTPLQTVDEIIEKAKEPKRPSKPREYVAISSRREVEREIRLWIRTNKEPHHPLYTQIIDFIPTSPTTLLILCHHCTFTVTCKNVDMEKLEAELHDEQVYCLTPFNAKKFDKPEDGIPVIPSITCQWGRLESQEIDRAASQGQA